MLALIVAATGYVGYVAVEGSRQLVLPADVSSNCTTPAQLGWTYEAINYDQADDARLASENDGHMDTCAEQGIVGTAVVSADGIRLAGWYIPAATPPDPAAPTVLIVHGHSDNKSAMLPYAEALHDRYNVVIMDLLHSGPSSGTQHTLGVLEQHDVRAMLDWLERTKDPDHIALLALSGGAAASLALSRTDDRIEAFITDSLHARSESFIARGVQEAGHPAYPGTWATLVGFWVRTGHDIRSADPVDSLPAISNRPLLLLHGSADTTDVPAESADLLYAHAQRLGMDVELRYCDSAAHAGVIETCSADYGTWVADFLSRSFGTAPDGG
jgi:pimeloyl-ACP methyl ester carboxylesterase